ncbi:MAG TPA: two-component system response regulator CreB [Gallionellaceae bacterium]
MPVTPPPHPPSGRQRILIVEDEPAIADTLKYALTTEGFEAEHFLLGQEALQAVQDGTYALALLDIGLPDMSGTDLLRDLRRHSPIPVIFLTARNSEIDRILGLEIGADDYVSKPFSPREVVARVRTVLRRAVASTNVAPASRFHVDPRAQRIHYHGVLLTLTRYEFLLLKTLLEQPLRIFSRIQLMQEIWAAPDHSLERTVDTHIKTLRAKLASIRPDEQPICTHRNQGYSLKP